jgi:hypothetical protein
VHQKDQLSVLRSGLQSDLQWVILWAVQLVNPLDQLSELLSGFLLGCSWAVLLARQSDQLSELLSGLQKGLKWVPMSVKQLDH